MYPRAKAHLKRVFATVLAVLISGFFTTGFAATASRPVTPVAEKPRTGNKLAGDMMQLLQANCLACHNQEKHKGGLQFTSQAALLKGADSGKVVIPGKPDKSNLLKVLSPDSDPHMPPKSQFSTKEIELVRNWIAAGSPWDQTTLPR